MRRGNTCDVWERKTVAEEHVCEYSRRCLVTMLGGVVVLVQMIGMIHAAGMDREKKKGRDYVLRRMLTGMDATRYQTLVSLPTSVTFT